MPRNDRTGPQGQGPRTGRGLGPCGTRIEGIPDTEERLGFFQRLGRGLGRGFGRLGRGRAAGQGRGRGMGRGRNI